ncbi:TetR/AcrR family transcriptional regulator [Actinomadura roseirufa]|uniref:TetR/AcrR family transcriptional regulator n=1 Tax=Actinomadura roseirufa TaxID=2094049 RepID=UPI001041A719|nr:TetR/AcrR family transcriptional regulator [Actinomadura roseirufa]
MTRPDREAGPAFEDLTARARIREAALRHFAEHGFARATIREIARTAGVSPGLVRHHFGSKESLRQACDDYALDQLRRFNDQIVTEGGFHDSDTTAEAWRSLQQPNQLYLARALIDDSATATSLFDEMVKITEQSLVLADRQRTDPAVVDRRLRATLMVAMALGIPAFYRHVSRLLDIDLFTTEGERQVALAMLDIHSHSVISPELAATLREGFAKPRYDPSPGER